MTPTPHPSHDAPTLDSADLQTPSQASSQATSPANWHVALVEGSTPELSAEIQCLLRLAAANGRDCSWHLVLACFSSAAFSLSSLIERTDVVLWILNGGIFAVLGVLGGGLCRRCPMTTRKLRLIEEVIFGLPSVYFLAGGIVSLMLLHQAESGA